MQYTCPKRQQLHDKLDEHLDKLLKLDNTEDLIKQFDIQFELLDLDETQAQIDNCKSNKTITRDVHEMTTRAIFFRKQELITELTKMIRAEQARVSLMIGE